MEIKIAIATHKKYWMPKDDIYLPLQVGNGSAAGYQRDNIGDNISERNSSYCELTAMYWLWKNCQADYKGLVHYRRHFTTRRFSHNKQKAVIDRKKMMTLLEKADIILPVKRNYYIESNEDHYAHAHYRQDIVVTRQVISELYPAYLDAFDWQMKQNSAHMFNMMIMRDKYFSAYCEWLFNILFAIEKRIDITSYDKYQTRLFGFLSELLLDVWLRQNNLSYIELPVVFLESQHWGKKIFNFLLRKVKGDMVKE